MPTGQNARIPDSSISPKSTSDRYWLISALVALLAIPILPLELGFGRVPVSLLSTALAGILAIAYARRSPSPFDRIELAVSAFGAWAAFRLLVLGPLAGEPVSWALALREIGVSVAAICIYRLAQQRRLRAAIIRGLIAALSILVFLEVYQMTIGLNRLLSHGYTTDAGFNYHTAAGGFRPFGLFSGPPTFGTFLAMVGVFLAFSAKRPIVAFIYATATLSAVVATGTRAAFIGVTIAAVVAILVSPRVKRMTAFWVVLFIFVPLSSALLVLMKFDILENFWVRLESAISVDHASRSGRLQIWGGVFDAVSANGSVILGLGDSPWVQMMSPHVGVRVSQLGHAHSNFFQAWYRYGIIGALLFTVLVAVILASCVGAVRLRRPFALGSLGACLVFISDSTFNNAWSSVNFVLMVFLLIGMSRPGVGSDPPT